MGTTLTGTTPQDTYDSLIKVTDNGPLSGTAKYLSDGLGNDSALALSTSRVGVGTSSPAYILDTRGIAATFNAGIDGVLQPTLYLGHPSYTTTYLNKISTSVSALPQGQLMQFSVGNGASTYADVMTLNGLGNVGIGTSSPAEKLDVIGGALAAGNGTIRTGITYSTIGLLGTFTNHDLGLITNGTEKARITSAGSLLVGTTTASTAGNPKLQVNGSVSKETKDGVIANATTITLFTLANNGVFLVTTKQNDDVNARSTTCLIFTESIGTTTRQVDLATGTLWTVSMSGLSVQLTNTSLQNRAYSASVLQLF